MISRQVAVLSAAAAIGLVAVTGCSSSSPTAGASGAAAVSGGSSAPSGSSNAAGGSNVGLSQAALITAVKAAADQATAVHVKGEFGSGSYKIDLDVQLNKKDATASGT
ncbi:MAG: hypothetical protein ACRDVE_12875, partial [Actinocrinis sp.]